MLFHSAVSGWYIVDDKLNLKSTCFESSASVLEHSTFDPWGEFKLHITFRTTSDNLIHCKLGFEKEELQSLDSFIANDQRLQSVSR